MRAQSYGRKLKIKQMQSSTGASVAMFCFLFLFKKQSKFSPQGNHLPLFFGTALSASLNAGIRTRTIVQGECCNMKMWTGFERHQRHMMAGEREGC